MSNAIVLRAAVLHTCSRVWQVSSCVSLLVGQHTFSATALFLPQLARVWSSVWMVPVAGQGRPLLDQQSSALPASPFEPFKQAQMIRILKSLCYMLHSDANCGAECARTWSNTGKTAVCTCTFSTWGTHHCGRCQSQAPCSTWCTQCWGSTLGCAGTASAHGCDSCRSFHTRQQLFLDAWVNSHMVNYKVVQHRQQLLHQLVGRVCSGTQARRQH